MRPRTSTGRRRDAFGLALVGGFQAVEQDRRHGVIEVEIADAIEVRATCAARLGAGRESAATGRRGS